MTVGEILSRALRYGAIAAAIVAVVGAAVGWLVAGMPGLIGALIAAVLGAVYLGLTGVSILIANRLTKGSGDQMGIFFAIVLGGWLVKLVLFLVFAISLRGAEWLHPVAFGVTAIAVVVVTLLIDVLTVARSRRPQIDIALPGAGDDASSDPGRSSEGPSS